MRLATLLLPLLAPTTTAFTVNPLKMTLNGPTARDDGCAPNSRRAFLGGAATTSLVILSHNEPATAKEKCEKKSEARTCGYCACDEDEIIEAGATVKPSDDWSDYKFVEIDHKRQDGYQKIKFDGSKTNTTEFLIVSLSHGNADRFNKPSVVKCGGWGCRTVYAGNDDRSVEIWSRTVTDANVGSDLGEIDTKDGKGAMAIVVHKKGIIKTGKTNSKTFKKKSSVKIDNRGKKPWLVVAVTDNGGSSKKADEDFGASKDDRCFVYLTTDKKFKDSSAGGIRGAIASVELK